MLRSLVTVLTFLFAVPALAGIEVRDDSGNLVTLKQPARRIVSLAPHATELLYAAGAGNALVGVSEYSDYPAPAKALPSVGGSAALDMERILTLKPDLIVAWGSGNSSSEIAKLRKFGFPVFESEPRNFETIATNLERLSLLAGTGARGQDAARDFRSRLAHLKQSYRDRPTVRLFYQIWRGPLLTLNDAHLVSQALRLCGGENIFGKLPYLTPVVSAEAVVAEDPEAIITGSSSKEDDPFSDWRRFGKMTAVARGNLFIIGSDSMSRSGPRVLEGTETLCGFLDAVRKKRK